MSENVQFDMDQRKDFTSHAVLGQSQVPGMAAWLMKKGIIKNESSAKGVLVGIIIADFVIAAIIIYFFVLK
jgi:hypothetical protein